METEEINNEMETLDNNDIKTLQETYVSEIKTEVKLKKVTYAIWTTKELKDLFHQQRKAQGLRTSVYLKHLLELGATFKKVSDEQD